MTNKKLLEKESNSKNIFLSSQNNLRRKRHIWNYFFVKFASINALIAILFFCILGFSILQEGISSFTAYYVVFPSPVSNQLASSQELSLKKEYLYDLISNEGEGSKRKVRKVLRSLVPRIVFRTHSGRSVEVESTKEGSIKFAVLTESLLDLFLKRKYGKFNEWSDGNVKIDQLNNSTLSLTFGYDFIKKLQQNDVVNNVGGLKFLTSDDNSWLLFWIKGKVYKLIYAGDNRFTGKLIYGLKNNYVKSKGWQLGFLGLKPSNRNLSDQQIAMAELFRLNGLLESRWNKIFFLGSASRNAELAGIFAALRGSLYTIIITLLISVPLGVGSALYLEEFSKKGRLSEFIEVNINNLAAVPSIVFGLLGLTLFINFFGLPRSSPLVGGMVLSLMTLPTIVIASRASLRGVPARIKDAALCLGATHTQAVFHQVLPLAIPGIMTGSIIGTAQALGETAPLLMVGMMAFITDFHGIMEPATVLPMQIYMWASLPDPAFVHKTSGAIIILLLVVISLNTVAVLVRNFFEEEN